MSELTPCNRCSVEAMQRRARQRGVELIVERVVPPAEMSGWTSARYSDEPEPSAYFLELSDECACD